MKLLSQSGQERNMYLTVGDPSLYSTWIYVHRELDKDYRDIDVELCRASYQYLHFAAQAKMSLAKGDESVAMFRA